MITKEYLVNPTHWFDLEGLVFAHHERYYLSIEKDKQYFVELFNKNWKLKKAIVQSNGNKTYKETEINEETAKNLITTKSKVVNALNYNEFRLPLDAQGADARLNLYSGPLNHLMVLKVKFKNERDFYKFKEPDYCLCDITDDPYFSQLSLSSKDYQNVQRHINRMYKGKINPPDFYFE